MFTNKDEALATLQQEAEYWLDEQEEAAADAELQRIMASYATIIEGELEWNLSVVNP